MKSVVIRVKNKRLGELVWDPTQFWYVWRKIRESFLGKVKGKLKPTRQIWFKRSS